MVQVPGTEKDCFEVFVMADPGEGEVVAEQISKILDPFLAPAVPEKVAIPPWFGQDTPARLGRNLPLIMVFVYCLMKISFLLCPPAMGSRMMKRMGFVARMT